MVERLLSLYLRGRVAASLQHEAPLLYRVWEAKVPCIVCLDTLTREWILFDLRAYYF